MKILLHVGMPKCGSSALQSYLSSTEFEKATAGRSKYVALHDDGKVLVGDALFRRAAVSSYGYVTSHSTYDSFAADRKLQRNALAIFKELSQEADTIVLSSEGWGTAPQALAEDSIFSAAGYEVNVIAYVRPQIEWLNTAWWQWGAWADVPFSRWLNFTRKKIFWNQALTKWQKKSWINKVDVRLLKGDIVQDFMSHLGYQIPEQVRTNQALPELVLRLFQRNRQLRPEPHESEIEFALMRHLNIAGKRAPWVMRQNMVERLLRLYHEDNESLLRFLPEAQRDVMRHDPRWWDVSAYADKKPGKLEKMNLPKGELEELTVAAMEAIVRLDEEVRRLRGER